MTPNPLIGTWKLLSWENRAADGRVTYPLGKDAVGYIIHTGDGYMSVAIMNPHRTGFSSEDLLGGSAAEKARSAETYVSSCGRINSLGAA